MSSFLFNMADSTIAITAGTGTAVDTRTESTNGHHRQVVVLGDPSTNAGVAPVDATAGLKVDLGVDNDVTVSGVSTAAKQDTIIGHVDGIETLLGTIDADTGTIATEVAGLLTDTELRATPVPVSGTVTANLSATDNAVLDTIAAKDFATQTTLAAMNAKMVSGTDIGDVTINNASGASAVNIQDGGNTITVDGTVAVTNSDITSIKTAVEIIDNAISGSEMQVDVVGALPAGTNAIGKLAANSGVDIGDVDVTSISAGTNLIGDVGIQPRTTNGLDTFMASGSDGSTILVATAQAVKASAGKVYGYYLYNPESAVTFVHFYNTASGSVTVGTTNPLFTLQIPPASAANLMSEIGITFGTAITIAATTTAGGNTAPATGVSATIWYK